MTSESELANRSKEPMLAEVLDAHRAFENVTPLSGALGDGFLYQHNRMYKNQRDAVSALGYKFTNEDFCEYDLYRFKALPDLVRRKTLIYVENAGPFRTIEAQRPGQFRYSELPPPRENYLVHEQAHCLIHHILYDAFKAGEQSELFKRVLLPTVMGEASAATAEMGGNAFVDSLVHFRLRTANSYFMPDPKSPEIAAFKDVVEAVGLKPALKTVFLSAVMHNCLFESVSKNQFVRILDLSLDGASPESDVIEKILRVSKFVLSPNRAFVVGVGAFYLKFAFGVTGSMFDLFNFDPLDYFDDAVYSGALDLYVDVLANGTTGKFKDVLSGIPLNADPFLK